MASAAIASVLAVSPHASAADVAGAPASSPASTTTVAHATARHAVITSTGSYGTGATQKVTVYRPDITGHRPAAFMIHGGGWVGGSRNQWAAEGQEWASRGWVVIDLDYTRGVLDGVSGDGKQMVADVQTAVKKYAASSRVDRTRMVIMGDSAGGHLATLTAAKMHGWFRGVIAWSPVVTPANAVTDGTRLGATTSQQELAAEAREFFGYSQRTTTALTYVQAYPTESPPMLIIASQNDFVTYQDQGEQLCLALGSKCTARLVAGSSHGLAILNGNATLAEFARTWALNSIKK